jgi:hypothetical protein
MGILLAFAPFVVFALVDHFWGPTQGLVSGGATSAALVIRDWMRTHGRPKILEIGTLILFGGMAINAVLTGASGSIMGVRLRVDAGLLAIVLVTMVIRRPFTLQYARERVSKDLWLTPGFIQTNYAITAAWAAAFAVVVAADVLLLYRPDLPSWIGIASTILALVGAFKFTQWYPDRKNAKN